jgi:D-alanine-D-alanine ligase
MHIGVLAGGPGGERDISLITADAVERALEALGWTPFRVNFGARGEPSRWPGGEGTPLEALAALERAKPDAAFIAMHGLWGEDGRVQAALELAGIRYQGSGVLASALAMDKIRSKEIFRAHGIPVAADLTVSPPDQPEEAARVAARLVQALGLPLALKTPGSGSSVGVAIADTAEDVAATLVAFSADADRVLAEAYVSGREFTCPVVESADGTPEAFPVVEIRPRAARFFDRAAKYDPGATDELCPAPIPAHLEAALRETGLAAHRALGCAGYSRTDVRVDDAGRIVVLETNTLPGLTPASLLPKSAAAAGLPFPELIRRLLQRAATS